MDAVTFVTMLVVVLIVDLTWERLVRQPHLRTAASNDATDAAAPAVWIEPRARVVRRNWLLALMGLAAIALIVPVSYLSNDRMHALLLGLCQGLFFVPLWLVLRGPRIAVTQPVDSSAN
jgi:hypothetical protein